MASLEAEIQRLREGVDASLVPPVLSRFVVELEREAGEYSDELKKVLDAALNLGITEDFEGEDVPVDTLSPWFVEVSSEAPTKAPPPALRGRSQYLSHITSGPWQLQDWLYRFCPEEESRGWAWWDLTSPAAGVVHIWVDSWGEDFFGCDDLRWLAYTAGASRLSGPELHNAERWLQEHRADENGDAR
ncbi:hypothetical protein [Streptomyces sp. WMMB 322]|uniref:hypothetical protein n=1 Tax=Streptomyces sp. WMMB 322 TaxID=1286821 RepID=UPI0020C7D747|nr:hypothetical protein [Streptomyces sp. WMMB 322]